MAAALVHSYCWPSPLQSLHHATSSRQWGSVAAAPRPFTASTTGHSTRHCQVDRRRSSGGCLLSLAGSAATGPFTRPTRRRWPSTATTIGRSQPPLLGVLKPTQSADRTRGQGRGGGSKKELSDPVEFID